MNSKLKSYIIPFLILLVSILLVMVGLQFYHFPMQEGLETRIRRQDGKIVKRKKKRKSIREGFSFDDIGDIFKKMGDVFNKVTDVFNKIVEGFKKMTDFFKKIGDIFNFIPTFFSYLGKFLVKVLDNILQSFLFVPTVFMWLGDYLKGAIQFVVNFPKCFKWYSLEAFGHTIYAPLKFLFWLFNLQYIEDMLWKGAEDIDCTVKKYTGYHLIHYSRDIQLQCYTFCPPDFPKFPDLDWSFNPPTLDIRF